MHLLI